MDKNQSKNRSRREALKRARQRAKAKGICTTCLANPAKPGKATCQSCIDKKTEYRKIKLEQNKNLCVSCLAKPARPGLKTCQECYDRMRRYIVKHKDKYREKDNRHHFIQYHIRKNKGLCTKCGKPTTGTGTYCPDCKQKYKIKSNK